MTEDTYNLNGNDCPLECFEWDHSWIEQTGNTSARRVLYIGDSISRGIRQLATQASGGSVLFDGFASSKAVDNPFLFPALELLARQLPGEDLILLNNGLHGWHLEDSEDYPRQYGALLDRLAGCFPGLPLALVLTTPVADPEREQRVMARNRAVATLAQQRGLPVIDLHSAAPKNLWRPDGVHYEVDGYRQLAEFLVQHVETLL